MTYRYVEAECNRGLGPRGGEDRLSSGSVSARIICRGIESFGFENWKRVLSDVVVLHAAVFEGFGYR